MALRVFYHDFRDIITSVSYVRGSVRLHARLKMGSPDIKSGLNLAISVKPKFKKHGNAEERPRVKIEGNP